MSFYICVENDGHQTIYGPFENRREAMLKNIFYRSNAEITAFQKRRGSIEAYAHVGVSVYGAAELADLISDPRAFGYYSCTALPASELKNHDDWATSDLQFLANYWLGAE